MTAYGDEKTAVQAMKAGALDYIAKSPESFNAIPRTLERALREWKLILERKRSEEELRESEIRFRTLYENVSIGLYRTTPVGKILLANSALVKILGYSSFEQLAEKNLSQVGFSKKTGRKEFLRMIETRGEIKDVESSWVRQDGSLITVRESARAIRDSHGKTLYYDGTVEDITERIRAEEEKIKLLKILEASLNEIYIFDINTFKFSYVNDAVLHNIGYTHNEILKLTMLDLNPGFQRKGGSAVTSRVGCYCFPDGSPS
jgi:PAS domain S-box-containing protein